MAIYVYNGADFGTAPLGADGDTVRSAGQEFDASFQQLFAALDFDDITNQVTAVTDFTIDGELSVEEISNTTGDLAISATDDLTLVYANRIRVFNTINSFVAEIDGNGKGKFEGGLSSGSHILPLMDNSYTLGDASFRMSEIFSVNGTINTSDVTLKMFMGDPLSKIPDYMMSKILDAMDKLDAGLYQWNKSLEGPKGLGARIFAGYSAQGVEQALLDAGLSQDEVEQIRVVCKDTIDIIEEVSEKFVNTRPVTTTQIKTTYEYVKNSDGKLVQKKIETPYEHAVQETLPVIHSNGQPVLTNVTKFILDDHGSKTYSMEPVLGADGEQLQDKDGVNLVARGSVITEVVKEPLFMNVDVIEEFEDTRMVDKIIGEEVRWGLDYTMLGVLTTEALRRRVVALENVSAS